jgi:hypothetical protein
MGALIRLNLKIAMVSLGMFLFIAQLATGPHSSGNAEFRKDINLEDNPDAKG